MTKSLASVLKEHDELALIPSSAARDERLFEETADPRRGRAAERQRVLMCAPEHFDVRYVINPWMENHVGKTHRSLAHEQWAKLHRNLAELAEIVLVPAAPGLPDMVFSANAGLVVGRRAIVSRFRAKERRGEEPLFRTLFERQGFEIAPWPDDVPFEGAGDALLDREQPIIWCGYGMRSGAAAPVVVERVFGRRTIGLCLVDPRFYHLDTCFCPLSDGWLVYYPPAFDAASRAAIEALVSPEKRIEIGEDDALQFACNAVELDKRVFMNGASATLQNRLRAAGFTPVLTPLTEFMKAGGAAKCLTLKLVEP
jgi:N-dimethylarginine dimethylaminohydrolase